MGKVMDPELGNLDDNWNYNHPEHQESCLPSDKSAPRMTRDEIKTENTRFSSQLLCCYCIFGFAETLKKILPYIDGTQLQLSTRLTLLLALTSVICLTLVCIVAIRHPEAFSQLQHEPDTPNSLKQIQARKYGKEDLQNEILSDYKPKDWGSLFQLAKTSAVKLYLQVESKENYIIAEENDSDGTFKIVGRPNFCSNATTTTHHQEAEYRSLTFWKTTHLILSHMSDCDYYVNLALNVGFIHVWSTSS